MDLAFVDRSSLGNYGQWGFERGLRMLTLLQTGYVKECWLKFIAAPDVPSFSERRGSGFGALYGKGRGWALGGLGSLSSYSPPEWFCWESGSLWAWAWEVLSHFESLLCLALSCTLIFVGCSCEIESWVDVWLLKSLQKAPGIHAAVWLQLLWIRIWLTIQTWGK